MIYDCFLFFNELDVLRIRLEELKDVVDKFVLVEATQTHSGRPKPLYYLDNIEEFSDFRDRIFHYVVRDMPALNEDSEEGRLRLEIHHRNKILDALTELGAVDDDIIILSDVDEIPRGSKIEPCVRLLDNNAFVTFVQRNHRYYLNNIGRRDANLDEWACSIAFKFRSTHTRPMQAIRTLKDPTQRTRTSKTLYLEDGGWHFSFLGGPSSIEYKIQSFCHAGYDTGRERITFDTCRSNLHNLASFRYSWVPVDCYPLEIRNMNLPEGLPKYLRDNPERFMHFFFLSNPIKD